MANGIVQLGARRTRGRRRGMKVIGPTVDAAPAGGIVVLHPKSRGRRGGMKVLGRPVEVKTGGVVKLGPKRGPGGSKNE